MKFHLPESMRARANHGKAQETRRPGEPGDNEFGIGKNRPCFGRWKGRTLGFTPGWVGVIVLAGLVSGASLVSAAEADTNTSPTAVSETNAQEILRAYLQVQEQLHLTQLAVEQNRKEARETAAQNSEMLAGRLQTIEKALESQKTRELETMQSSNRVMLLVAGSFASVGFLAMLLMSVFQWRTVNRLAQISAALPPASPPGRAVLGPAEAEAVTIGPAEQSSLRMLGSLEQLEKRILQLEHTTRPALDEGTSGTNGDRIAVLGTGENGHSLKLAVAEQPTETGPSAADLDRINVLMGKGQSMLSLDDASAAVACFDEALQLDPNNAEAWVRKGAALERLQQLDQAVECYDRAIAADRSLTVAYLHKGGLFNRMERFSEALECYEKALRTQEKRSA